MRPDTAPKLFHLALLLDSERCLVVGGGPVAARKVASLLECGAAVTVVAPEACPALRALRDAPARAGGRDGGALSIEQRRYRSGEARGYSLVITATGRPEVDKAVYLDCRRAGILVNAADNPESCSFLMPAVLREGPISVAVSTGGTSPFLAGWVRRRIGAVVGPDVGLLAEVVGSARSRVRAAGRSSEGLPWEDLVDGVLWPLITGGKLARAWAAADAWVRAATGGFAGTAGDGTAGGGTVARDGGGGACGTESAACG